MVNRSFLFLIIMSILIFAGCFIEGKVVNERSLKEGGRLYQIGGTDFTTTVD